MGAPHAETNIPRDREQIPHSSTVKSLNQTMGDVGLTTGWRTGQLRDLRTFDSFPEPENLDSGRGIRSLPPVDGPSVHEPVLLGGSGDGKITREIFLLNKATCRTSIRIPALSGKDARGISIGDCS